MEKKLHEAQKEETTKASCDKCVALEKELDSLNAKNQAYLYLRSRVYIN